MDTYKHNAGLQKMRAGFILSGCQMGFEPTASSSTVRRSAIELLAPYAGLFYHEEESFSSSSFILYKLSCREIVS
jgi:hypothetical protein